MTRDPAEGLDPEGFLTTGVARHRVPAAYEPVLADATGELAAVLGARLHGLYVYGSVATGHAVAPASDVDLLAVLTVPVDGAEVAPVLARLSVRYAALTREVALSRMTLAELSAADDDGLGCRAFVRHYCVGVHGIDLVPTLPPVRVSAALAYGFNGDLAPYLDGTDPAAPDAGRRAARRLLLAAGPLESAAHGGWTTDRATAAALVARHHPEWTDDVDRALRWLAGGPADPAEVRALLAGFGRWLVAGGCLPTP